MISDTLHFRPRIRVLSDEQIEQIHVATMILLFKDRMMLEIDRIGWRFVVNDS